MNKVIIRTREDELTNKMYIYGNGCAIRFIRDSELETYGKNWDSCVYSNEQKGMKALVKINIAGTISVCVFSKHSQ
jgi:hypothetical protein